MELQRTKGVSDLTYDRALKVLGGEDKVIEAVAVQGYYALLAMVMNTARTPLPEGRTPPLPLFRAESERTAGATALVGRLIGRATRARRPGSPRLHVAGVDAQRGSTT